MADKKILNPRTTEKSYKEQTKRTYVFQVNLDASKQEVAKRVAEAYQVTVEDVRVLTRNGKKAKFSRGKHAYPGITTKKDKKFAYVTLKEGDSIKVFEDENEASESAKKDNKASAKDSKAEKKAEKEAKKAEKAAKAASEDKNAGKENK